MARHVDGYACEWKGVLDDPDKLSRFVSFVNAPDVADPDRRVHRARRAARCRSGCPTVMPKVGRRPHDPARRCQTTSRSGRPACDYDRLLPGRGVGVLLPDGAQVALFRLDDGIAAGGRQRRPVLGCGGDVARHRRRPRRPGVVQSPIKKQAFALDDGTCLDDPDVALPVYRTRITDDGHVEGLAPSRRPNVRGRSGSDGSRARRNRLAINRTIAGMRRQRIGHHVGAAGPQPILEQAVRQQV